MPSISSRLKLRPISPDPPITTPLQGIKPPLSPAFPGMSPILRTPLPNLVIPASDSLRQYYAGGRIPQYRFSPLKPIS